MLKRYLNSEEKQRIIATVALKNYLEETIEIWDNLNRTKDVLKYLRSGIAFINKALQIICSETEKDSWEQLIKYAGNNKFGLIECKRKHELVEETFSTNDIEMADNIAESLMYTNCRECKHKDHENCSIRKLMSKWNIEPYKTVVDENECPFNNGELLKDTKEFSKQMADKIRLNNYDTLEEFTEEIEKWLLKYKDII